jgi:hypothetical protein
MADNPTVHVPGERYECDVPDTLDLADRAELAINGIGGTLDVGCHHTQYFNVYYACQPPYMRHQGSADVTCDPKYGESLPMMRAMCGSDQYAGLEADFRRELMGRLDREDGLYYNVAHADRPWSGSYNPEFGALPEGADAANVGGCGRMLRALVTWREVAGDDSLNGPIRALVAGLSRIAIRRDDYAFYPVGRGGEPFSYLRSGWADDGEPASETEGAEGSVVAYHGHQIQGLMRWFSQTGDEEALDLAGRLSRFCALPRFWGGVVDLSADASGLVGHVAGGAPSPPCIAGEEQGHWYTHFHARAVALRGILEYARMAGDQRLLEFVRQSYEFTRTMGIPRIGFVNCWPGRSVAVEGCALGDLVALGARLSDAGVGDYFDDVDAVVRNHLVEGQLTDGDLLARIGEASAPVAEHHVLPGQESTEDVIARSLGNFAGASTPADIPAPWVMQCCTGNGTQGLYYAWEAIVRGEGDLAQINLLLNRASPWLDIDSHLPHEGKVVIRVKTARRLAVRIPVWVRRAELRARVGGCPREGAWVGNCLLLADLAPGDAVTLAFPVPESTASYTVAARIPGQERVYTLRFRGSTVVEVSPHDDSPTTYPLYQREHLRSPAAPMRRRTRFVASRTITGW